MPVSPLSAIPLLGAASAAAPADAAVVTVVTDPAGWDAFAAEAGAHPLQLWGWGALKSSGPWKAIRLRVETPAGAVLGGAQVLVRSLPFPFRAWSYVPRGPFATQPGDLPAVATAVSAWCRANVRGIGISFEPDVDAAASFVITGSRPAANTVLWPTTLIIDLSQPTDAIMGAMAKKTRQYIRKSDAEALTYRLVENDDEVAACLAIYHQTAQRAGFALHSDAYYRKVATCLGEGSQLFAAFSGPDPVAFLWLAASRSTAFELYGGMNDAGQRLRANYALKWHAMMAMRDRAVTRYDLNGLLNDGISTFKRGFADHEDQLMGTVDVPFNPLYTVWSRLLPTAKRAVRRLSRRH